MALASLLGHPSLSLLLRRVTLSAVLSRTLLKPEVVNPGQKDEPETLLYESPLVSSRTEEPKLKPKHRNVRGKDVFDVPSFHRLQRPQTSRAVQKESVLPGYVRRDEA